MHIIRDWRYFWTYNPSLATPVSMVNCGVLNTLARGEVHFRALLGGIECVFCMPDCLHALDIPINLLSVGAMAEKHVHVVFDFGVTSIYIPWSSCGADGLFLSASMVDRLSFLKCDFILLLDACPSDLDLPSPVTFPALSTAKPMLSFPHTPVNPELWHRHFGHLGMDATCDVLTKPYASGVSYDGPFTHSHCIPCIIGKHPQQLYSSFGHCAARVCDLLHMDTCGPFPVLTPGGTSIFLVFLDHSNYGHTVLLAKKSDAFAAYLPAEARWEHKSGNRILAICSDGAKEFVEGVFGEHMAAKGITHQVTVPYTHAQNGKAEQYVHTLEDTAQTLLADSGLPAEFYSNTVLTAQYLRNHLPMSTLPPLTTPYKVMEGSKLDLSHLHIWGSQCFVAIPPECHTKGGPHRFEAIFVGYEDDCVGWCIQDTAGKYSFSRNVIFNEDVHGHLKQPLAIPGPASDPVPPVPCPRQLLNPTEWGKLWSDAVCDHDACLQCLHALHCSSTPSSSGGVILHPQQSLLAVNDFVSYMILSEFTVDLDTSFLECSAIIDGVCLTAHPNPFHLPKSFDLSKAPLTYHEAVMHSDIDTWRVAMQCKMDILQEHGMFKSTTLPPGWKAIGTQWVFAYKLHPDGSIIQGKEKACLVAQGFSQHPEDFGETYAPVAKMTSMRVILAFMAAHDYELLCYNVKSAFLHALLSHQVYLKQIQGFSEADLKMVYLALWVIYGLPQSSHEFYCLLHCVLEGIGLSRCEVNHALFYGHFSSSPDPSVPMPLNRTDLIIFMPVHVDDSDTTTARLCIKIHFSHSFVNIKNIMLAPFYKHILLELMVLLAT